MWKTLKYGNYKRNGNGNTHTDDGNDNNGVLTIRGLNGKYGWTAKIEANKSQSLRQRAVAVRRNDKDRTSLGCLSSYLLKKINVAWRTALALQRLNILFQHYEGCNAFFDISFYRSRCPSLLQGKARSASFVFALRRVHPSKRSTRWGNYRAQVDCRSAYISDSLKVPYENRPLDRSNHRCNIHSAFTQDTRARETADDESRNENEINK